MSNAISSLQKEGRLIPPPDEFSNKAYFKSTEEYDTLYKESVEHPEKFWGRMAEEHLSWFRKWDTVMEADLKSIGEVERPYVKFFSGGKLNVSYNCLDRHLHTWRRNKAAIIWQGEEEAEKRTVTYQELHAQVCRFANVLKKFGVKKGTTVTIYLPMIVELPVAMLACARLGAIHSVVFSAFSTESLRARIQDAKSEIVITSDVAFHGGNVEPLKVKVNRAVLECPSVRKVIVFNRGNGRVTMEADRDYWWESEMYADDISPDCPAEELDSEDPLFILYTSGSTGTPKGVLHTTAGYLLHTHLTFKYIFDYREEDLFWCTADIGWVTGHSYLVYGPLSNGATVMMYEGGPMFPKPDRFWKIIEDYKVNIFYTAPTAIRSLMRLGEEWPEKHDLSSLRMLGSVGEPINPEAWLWYHRVIGQNRCPIVDTWWQTETGGIMISTLPGAQACKPGSAGKPFFGIVPEILKDEEGQADVNQGGLLAISAPWPGMIRGVYGDKKNELIKNVYFSKFQGKYFTGDGARLDNDGYYWLLGRVDDVINVAAHRISTAEVESALVSHKYVAEAAVVGCPHETKGQGIYCFVTLKQGIEPADDLKKVLTNHVRSEISPIASPEYIHFTPALPKTRSGKIMRRILKKIAEGKTDELGDISTLADPSVVDSLKAGGRRHPTYVEA